jgi:hypothetical protein
LADPVPVAAGPLRLHVFNLYLCDVVFGNFSTFKADVKLSAAKFY